MSNQTKINFK